MRLSERAADELRPISFEKNVARFAEGSCLVKYGHTHVLCTASLENSLPPWLRGQGRGWVTAEYSMIPRATLTRNKRDISTGRPSGRTQEIQRLIGRSLRSVMDLTILGERQIIVDCDVLQADGGTRTASITGGWIALHECLKWMHHQSMFERFPLKESIAGISCGIIKGQVLLDLDYKEDSTADTDANFVITGKGHLVEVQASAESGLFTQNQFLDMLTLAQKAATQIAQKQREICSFSLLQS